MTFQEILEGIIRHRANPINADSISANETLPEIQRKLNEIEWALHALAEKLSETEK